MTDRPYIKTMKAHAYIDQTRAYLDYLDEHIEDVRKAFIEIVEKGAGKWWVGDEATYHALHHEVVNHDLSKLSVNELCQYRSKFYPVPEERINEAEFSAAWENHKLHNHHHHETAENHIDILHMIIDWTAMGYKFNNTAQQYYEANKDKIRLSDEHVKFMYEVFETLAVKEHKVAIT